MTQPSPDHNLVGYLAKATEYGQEILHNPEAIQKVVIVDPVTGKEAQVETNGGQAINIQDQHSRALDMMVFAGEGIPTTLTVATVIDDYTITIADTTNYVDGNMIGVYTITGEDFTFFQQIGPPVGNVITLDRPMDHEYPIGSLSITGNHHMNVNGSVTPQIFQIGPIPPGSDIEIDITRIMGYIEDDADMDDAKFGGIAALTRGLQLRITNGATHNLWNAKTNGEIALICFDANYTPKAKQGLYGYRFRSTYAGQSKHGVTLRLEPEDILEIIIQDDLTDLTDFMMMVQGHLVTD